MTSPANEWRENYNVFVKDVREYGDFPESLASHVEKFIEHTFNQHSAQLVERISGLKKNPLLYYKEGTEWMGEERVIGFNKALDQAIDIVKDNK